MNKKCFVIIPFSKTVDNHDEEYWTIFFDTIKKIMRKRVFYVQDPKWDHTNYFIIL